MRDPRPSFSRDAEASSRNRFAHLCIYRRARFDFHSAIQDDDEKKKEKKEKKKAANAAAADGGGGGGGEKAAVGGGGGGGGGVDGNK